MGVRSVWICVASTAVAATVPLLVAFGSWAGTGIPYQDPTPELLARQSGAIAAQEVWLGVQACSSVVLAVVVVLLARHATRCRL